MNTGNDSSLFGFNGGFTRLCGKLFDTLMLGILWILCSLPIITIGASTTALYHAMVKSVKNDDGYPSRVFFRSFHQNFKQATVLWLIYLVLIFIAQLNCGILMEKMDGTIGAVLIGFYVAICLWLILMATYTFPALSRFEMGTGWFLKISAYMTVRYFLTSLMLVVILGCAIGLVWRYPVFAFVVPGPVSFLISEFMERVLARHQPKEAAEDPEESVEREMRELTLKEKLEA
jgi:uncharacterized membrane protein YesL